MLPENLRSFEVAAALDGFDPECISTGKYDRAELTLEIEPAKIVPVCRFLKEQFAFVRLSTVTGVDRYPSEPRFEVVYHLHSLDRNERLRLKSRVGTRSGEAEIDSVTEVWQGAGWYEREVFDLFGVRFRNHPDLRRIMMPEDWNGHPLRKDYPTMGAR
jgi:NADH-quinone oxidoreductase subunit C